MNTSVAGEPPDAELVLLRQRLTELERANAALRGENISLWQQVETLRESETHYRLVTEHADEVFWLWDTSERRFVFVNQAYERLTGCTCASLYLDPSSYLELVHPEDREHVWREGGPNIAGTVEYRIITCSGAVHWVLEHSTLISDDQGKIVRRVGVIKDITDQKNQEEQIKHLTLSDPLTGLANRHQLNELGNTVLAAIGEGYKSVALLYLDLNRFKSVNDTLGHSVGDELLTHVAARLLKGVRTSDTLARLSGDEFAVLLPNAESNHAIAVAERMLESLNQPFLLHGQLVYIDASIGIAISTSSSLPFSTLLTQADIAMIHAKQAGGGVQMYDIALDTVNQNRLVLETDFRLALATDELVLYYQPIMDLRSNKIARVEALIRWHHPSHGLLTPDAFLALADDIGSMREVDSWVLRHAIAQAAAWYSNGHPLCVAVNLTAHSLQDTSLVEEVSNLLQRYSVPPHQVTIELTEHIGLRDLALTRQVLTWLRKLGLHIALDDFGNGYASLTYLQQMPFDVLKIDRSFTRGIRSESRDEAVARALLALGHGMGLQVVFEGVENEQQLAWLREAGCTWAQGYFIGRPQPADRIVNP